MESGRKVRRRISTDVGETEESCYLFKYVTSFGGKFNFDMLLYFQFVLIFTTFVAAFISE